MNLYNEIDPFCAAWLRELIVDKRIAPGIVADCDIKDLTANDLRGITQFHAFCGIGVWPLAARLVGWPDERPLDSGSCPCPPFSSAGPTFRCPRCDTPSPVPNAVRTGAFNCIRCDHEWQADERHLWPEFFRLIRHRQHVPVVGEQVASRDGRTWIDIVRASLEMLGRPVGVADTCAAGFGAPHIRQRLYWLADTSGDGYGQYRDEMGGTARTAKRDGEQRERLRTDTADGGPANRLVGVGQPGLAERSAHSNERRTIRHEGDALAASVVSGRLAEPHRREREGLTGGERRFRNGASVRWDESDSSAQSSGPASRVADGPSDGWRQERPHADGQSVRNEPQGQPAGSGSSGSDSRPGPTNGFWRDADWLFCRDGKWRPVEPSSELMVDAGAIRRAVAAGGREDRQEKGSIIRYSPLAQAGQYVNRVDELKGAGNAVNVAQAAGWLRAVMETIG